MYLFLFYLGIEGEDADQNDMDSELFGILLIVNVEVELTLADVPVLSVLDVVAELVAESDLGAVLESIDELYLVNLISLKIYIRHDDPPFFDTHYSFVNGDYNTYYRIKQPLSKISERSNT